MSATTTLTAGPFTDADTGDRLQQILAATLDLGLQVKQAHWNLRGAGFRPVHLQLDEIADGLRDSADELAERAVTVGTPADGRSTTVAQTTPLEQLPAGPLGVADAVAGIAERLDAV
ncbi:MAG TPA: DNA starvation/stationary phase protection protein, partial [Solirubrobacteraceae bacterium]|nr:DNA starvation/stationary phase protection protein [Solirubrobacteraceae bacterium]